jgi:hypothetical protein
LRRPFQWRLQHSFHKDRGDEATPAGISIGWFPDFGKFHIGFMWDLYMGIIILLYMELSWIYIGFPLLYGIYNILYNDTVPAFSATIFGGIGEHWLVERLLSVISA